MRNTIITLSMLGAISAQADMLTSTQRFFGMGGQVPDYTDEGRDVEASALGQAPYSPADSDLGLQSILEKPRDKAPLIFDFSTTVSRTDNAPSFNQNLETSSWVSASNMSLTWRPHITHGWFGDLGIAQDLVRYDRSNGLDFENLNLRLGVYKNLAYLDDTTLFARYEYQRLTFTSLSTGEYNAQRIRAGLQKTLWAMPRHQLTGSVNTAYEWSAHPALVRRQEYGVDLAYRYSITDSIYTVATARLSRYNFEQFARDDWTFGSGVELVWQINPRLRAVTSLYYERNDSSDSLGIGNFNEYQSWTSGVGIGLQWVF